MAKGTHNIIISRSAHSIGHTAAEDDDEFLFDCFVDVSSLRELRDMESSLMIALGRTGSGKTAIIRYIERHSEHAALIDPIDMALHYVSNSDIMRFLHNIGADLDVFFQTLWKHTLCLQYIRARYDIKDEAKSRSIFDRIAEWAQRDKSKTRAVEYLRAWNGKFWITMDENIKEITEKAEGKLAAELGADVEKFKAKANYDKQLSRDRKAELVARARKIIAGEQVADLSKVMELLGSEDFRQTKSNYYILIDKLDENWVDDSLKFRLIRALVEALKAMRKVHGLKIVVALRTDVLERVFQEPSPSGFQREKYESYMSNIKWQKDQLKTLVNRRINSLYRRKYTRENVNFEDLFPHQVGNKDSFDYILERTLYRPRDIISFINHCLDRSVGDANVNARHIREAEAEYSRQRHIAINDEWNNAFPMLPYIIKRLAGGPQSQELNEVYTREVIDDLSITAKELDVGRDSVSRLLRGYFEGRETEENVRKTIGALLYRVGVIGVKKSSAEPFSYAHSNESVIDPMSLSEQIKIRVHPMLHRALNIRLDRGS